MYKNHIFQVTTKHLHLDLFVDFQQKVSKVFQVPHTKEKQCAVFFILISSKILNVKDEQEIYPFWKVLRGSAVLTLERKDPAATSVLLDANKLQVNCFSKLSYKDLNFSCQRWAAW